MTSEKKLAAGQQFGQWRLIGEDCIGKGGNGVVWKAQNTAGAIVALKFLHRHHFTDLRIQRFRDEVEFLRKEGDRAGILPLLDDNLSAMPTAENRPWFASPIAVPFTKLSLAGPAKLPELVHKVESVARTLAALHAESKWHRDLKSDNLFVLNDNAVLGDFGLVWFPEKSAVTDAVEVMGPLYYIAPEMMGDAAGKPAGPADVYSLAKVLWVLASGHTYPLQGEQRVETPALRLSTYCPHPRASYLDRLIERATQHDVLLRPTMIQFADELAAFLKTPEKSDGTPVDFEALAKEYGAIFAPGNRAEQQREQVIGEGSRILTWFEHILHGMAKDIYTVTQTMPQVGSLYDLPTRYQARVSMASPQVIWREAKGVSTKAQAGNIAVRLFSFIQAEALADGSVRLVAGHHIQLEIGSRAIDGGQKSSFKELKAPAGSVQLNNGAGELAVFLTTNLGEAIVKFAESAKTQSS